MKRITALLLGSIFLTGAAGYAEDNHGGGGSRGGGGSSAHMNSAPM